MSETNAPKITRTPSVESEILFRNIPWGISYAQFQKMSDFPLNPLKFSGRYDPEAMVSPLTSYYGKYTNDGISGAAEAAPNTPPSSNSLLRMLNPRGSFELTVAGQKVIQAWAYFAQVPVNGELLYSENNSAFMVGVYNFINRYDQSKQSLLNELKSKLTVLYGIPTDTYQKIKCEECFLDAWHWCGKNDTHVTLKATTYTELSPMDPGRLSVMLYYSWCGAEKYLSEADKLVSNSVALRRARGGSNFDGL